MYELSIVELELISGAGPIADVTTGMGGAIGGGIGNLAQERQEEEPLEEFWAHHLVQVEL
ncbi:hypothetical protein [Kingella negevensis]|uniref:hypothetical protein n=1 Tax=Kingella negevensis TaxID=1522312 RepID=UPI001FD7419C|nr:hypothetical protein [Kingella negevensis]WII91338.1 hypothetical protein QEO93_01730 [Kingella negevensis]